MDRVFICHGHDSNPLWELKGFLGALGLEPVVLLEQDDLGLTLIEKFEYYAEQCKFAFALLTPDDRQAQDLEGQAKWRARQNVILELGWFMHKLGRRCVALLHKGEVELPSDLIGILYLPFSVSIFEVSGRIRQRLEGCGLPLTGG